MDVKAVTVVCTLVTAQQSQCLHVRQGLQKYVFHIKRRVASNFGWGDRGGKRLVPALTLL